MKYLLFLVFSLFWIPIANTQTPLCKVLPEPISGTYTGDCKDGLAHGRGTATGEDTYTGIFREGLPHGRGTYVYANGDRYRGYWKNGLRHGKGRFRYTLGGKKQTLRGYWKEGEYAGTENPDVAFRVVAATGIMNHKIEKKRQRREGGNEIVISIQSAFADFVPSDLHIETSSGQMVQAGRKVKIYSYFLPFQGEISYTILVGSSRKQCRFVFDILEEGEFTVTLYND